MADDKILSLVAEGLETYCLPTFAATLADDVEIQARLLRVFRLGTHQCS